MKSERVVVEPIIAALDRLNGHARAYGCGWKAIYAYKTLAALEAIAGKAENARLVGVVSKCDGCGGTGRFMFWDGERADNCRRCSSKGYVRLRFVETTIGAVRWHHPWSNGGNDILLADWGAAGFEVSAESLFGFYDIAVFPDGTKRKFDPGDPGDWRPRQGGARLPTDEAATLLADVEEWVLTLCQIRGWRRDSAINEMKRYLLRIDREPDGPCCICGADEPKAVGFAHMRGHLDWSTPACEACAKTPVAQWPKEPPERLLTPAVRRWLANPMRAKTPEMADG